MLNVQSEQKSLMSKLMTYSLMSALAFASINMTGCSRSLKLPEAKPAKLTKLGKNTSAITPVWTYNLGGDNEKDPLRLQMVQQGDSFYASSRDGEVIRLNKSGEKVWAVNLKTSITSGVSTNTDVLVVSDHKAVVYALNLNDGQQRWKTTLSGSVISPALVTKDRVVLVGNDGMISGLDSRSGKTVWRFKINVPTFSLRGAAKPIKLSNNFAVVAAADGRIHAFRIDSGLPMWVRRVGASTGKSDFTRLNDADADPVFYKLNLYTASFQSHIVGINMNNRKELFQIQESSTKTMAVNESSLFFSRTDGVVKAVNRMTGETLWEQNALLNRGLSNPVLVNDAFIVVGDAEGYLHTLDAKTGNLLGRVHTRGAVAYINQQDDLLLTQSERGRLAVWRMPDAVSTAQLNPVSSVNTEMLAKINTQSNHQLTAGEQ